MTQSAELSVGLQGAFTGPSELGKWCRDDITFHVVTIVADTFFLDDYELREVFSAELPMSYPLEQESGEVVMMARSDEVGGPLPDDRARALLTRLDEIGRKLELTGPLTMLVPAKRAVLLPPPSLAGTIDLPEPHPLRGAFYISVIDVLKLLTMLEPTDPEAGARVRTLLEFCREERLPLSWHRSGEG
jgi:hypothetical protein